MQDIMIVRRRLIGLAITSSAAVATARLVLDPGAALAYPPPAMRDGVEASNRSQCTVLESIERLVEDVDSFKEKLQEAISELDAVRVALSGLDEEVRNEALPEPARFLEPIREAMVNPLDLPLDTIDDYANHMSRAAEDAISILAAIDDNAASDEDVVNLFSTFKAMNLLNSALVGFGSQV